MDTRSSRRKGVHPRAIRAALLGATFLAGTTGLAIAQEASSPTTGTATEDVTEVIVVGYRGSLQSSTQAKKRDVGFSDSIFAEDMGKFPDTNIAESFNRIPGVNISREVTGEGINVSIRGLGTNFTRVLLNGAPVAVASTGSTDSQNTNREVDLDLMPTELFSQLTVTKSPTASLIEGGAAGTVNLRQARPFDKRGKQLVFSVTGVKNSEADDMGYKASVLGSATFDKWGIIGGVSYNHTEVNVSGFETIGWTNANLSATQNTGTRNTTGGGNWTIPGTVPANAGNGLTTGDTIDQAFLLANNPGLSIQQIDNAIIPRLGRPMNEFGTKDRISGIFGLEYRPSDTMRFYLDTMYAKKENDLERTDMNWVGRNGAMIPLNMQVDKDDCANGCTVTEGTFANAQFFLEYRPYWEDTTFYGINPGFEWEITDRLRLTASANYTKSEFHRESPTFLVITPASSGLTVTYDNTGGDFPTITSNVDLNDPANFQWNGGRVNIQDERRETETKGVRADLKWGDDTFNVQIGTSYDDTSRWIRGYDNSQAWQNAVCGNNPNVFLPGPNAQPPCNGLNAPGATPNIYPGLGTGYTAGYTTPLAYQGSLIPASELSSYLSPGKYGYITVDWDRFARDSQYAQFHDAAPESGGANTGASGGYVGEKVTGFYLQANSDVEVFNRRLRFNYGARYVKTEQTIGGRISLPDPRNTPPSPAPALPDGAKYPNIVNFAYTESEYENWLPSISAAYNLMDNLVVRASKSVTMTRANPNTMLPGLNFGSPSADVGSVGNPSLDPYISDNTDIGFEYYTGREGYFGVALFQKRIKGFTQNGNTTVPFSALSQYGVTYDTLNPTQQAAINSRGGPGAATVVLTQQVNSSEVLTVKGTEFNWVQPLDQFWAPLEGFGVSANLTLIEQESSNPGFVATGVPEKTYNLTAYYERNGIMVRISDTYRDGSQSSGFNQNGIANAALFANEYEQVDLSSSIDLGEVFGIGNNLQVTFDAINLTDQAQRQYFQFDNAAFTYYKPGTTYMVGLRGRF